MANIIKLIFSQNKIVGSDENFPIILWQGNYQLVLFLPICYAIFSHGCQLKNRPDPTICSVIQTFDIH